jgi:anti-sigma factor RsiW
MKAHHSELISALVDGELKGLRRWLIQRHVSRCTMCAAEYRHLLHVRKMLAENPVSRTMSDSPEFFWSKVKREIQAREGQTADIPMPSLSLTDWLGRHRYAFASVVTTLVAVVGLTIALQAPRTPSRRSIADPILPQPVATVEHASTLIPNTVATTIQTKDAEPAVIWVSGLPWTPDMNELKTQFAQLDS